MSNTNNNNDIKAAAIDQSNAASVANNLSSNEKILDPVAPLTGDKATTHTSDETAQLLNEASLKQALLGVTPIKGNDYNARMINNYVAEVGPDRLKKMFKWMADSKEVLGRLKNITKYNLSTITNGNKSATGFVETFDSRTYEDEDDNNEYGSPLTTTCDQDHTLLRLSFENPDGALSGSSVGFPVIHKSIDQLLVSRLTDSLGKQSPVDGKVFDIRSLINANVLPVIKNGSITHCHRVAETLLQVIARAFCKPSDDPKAGYDYCNFEIYDIYDLPRPEVQRQLTTNTDFSFNESGSLTVVCDSLTPHDILNDLILYGVGFTHLLNIESEYANTAKTLKVYVNSCRADLGILSNFVDITSEFFSRMEYYNNDPQYVNPVVIPFKVFFDQIMSGSQFVGVERDRLAFVRDSLVNDNNKYTASIGALQVYSYASQSWTALNRNQMLAVYNYLVAQWRSGQFEQWKLIKDNTNFYIPTSVLGLNNDYHPDNGLHRSDNYITFDVRAYEWFAPDNKTKAPKNINSIVKAYNFNDYLAALHAFTTGWYFQVPVHIRNKVYTLNCGKEHSGPGLYRDNPDDPESERMHIYKPEIILDQSSVWARIGMFYGQLEYLDKHAVILDEKVVLRNKVSNYAKYLSGSFCHFAQKLYGSVFELNRRMPQLLRMKLASVQDMMVYQHDVDVPVPTLVPAMTRFFTDDYTYDDPILKCGWYDNQHPIADRDTTYYLVEYYNLAEWWRYDYFDGPWYDAPSQLVCPNRTDEEYTQKDDVVFVNRDSNVGTIRARFTPNGRYSTLTLRSVLTWDSENSVFRFVIPKLFKNSKIVRDMLIHGYDLWTEMTPEWVVPYGYHRGFVDAGNFTEEINDSLF